MEYDEEAKEYEVKNPWEETTLTEEEQEEFSKLLQEEEKTEEEKTEEVDDSGTPEKKEEQPEEKEEVKEEEPEEPVVELDGEKIPVSEVKEWKQGYLRQQDYTKKTQALADARKAIEQERIQLQELRMMFEQMFGQQPTAQTPPAGMSPYQQPYGVPQQPPEEEMQFATETEKRLYEELQQIKQAVGGLIQHQQVQVQKSALSYVENCINEFKAKHPNISEDEMAQVLERANNLGVMPSVDAFDTIYKGMLDIEKIKQEAIKEYVEKELPKKQKAKLESSKELDREETESIEDLDENELFERMVQEFKSGG